MKVFVTGGSGFVGGHVIEALAGAKATEVMAMARSERSAEKVAGFGATPVHCSLEHVTADHLEGVDAIVHCAAFVEEWGTREQFWSMNVEGTRQLLEVARQAGVKRFVHIGTEAALFDGSDLVDVDESHPYPAKQRFLYSETKAEAERLVLAANGPEFTTLSLRPRFVWGPRDTSVLPAVLRMVEEGNWMWLDGGRVMTSTVHVANLAHAVSLALVNGHGGEAYFIVDEGQRTIKSFLTDLAGTQGTALPDKSAPSWLIRGVATVVEGVWRLFRLKKTPPLTRFAIAMMSSTVTVDGSKATRELGYRPRLTVAEGLRQLTT